MGEEGRLVREGRGRALALTGVWGLVEEMMEGRVAPDPLQTG